MSVRMALFGAGGHARVVAATLRRLGWTLVGCIDEFATPDQQGQLDGAPVAGAHALASWGDPHNLFLHVAIGDNRVRWQRCQMLLAAGWSLPAVVDPMAICAPGLVLGAGCFVAPAAVLNPGVVLGAAVIVNSAAVVEHDVHVGDGSHLAPRCVLGGHARVGALSLVGLGSIVRDRAEVGRNVVLGAGSLVLRRVPDDCVAWGAPAQARSVRETADGHVFP